MTEKKNRKKNCEKSNKLNFKVNKLVSNLPQVARNQDVDLINAWGILVHDDIIWVADNGTGFITSYDFKGNKVFPNITVPPATVVPPPIGTTGKPTGIIFNKSKGFVISNGTSSASSFLLIATEDGTIAGYNPLVDPLNAITVIDNSLFGAVYKGLALSENLLYAADFFNNKIDVFNSDFVLIPPPINGLRFADLTPTYPIPSSFAPFNIVRLHEKIYVLYARQNPPDNEDDLPGKGFGFVNVFDLEGNFIKRLISGGKLNSPWGFAIGPKDFGKFSGKFLIGNFGDGRINAYDHRGNFIGTLRNKRGRYIFIDGLWGLYSLNKKLFFASGPNFETNGLVGIIKKK